MNGKFWVFDWLKDNNITSLDQAAILLPKYKVIDDLQARAVSADENDVDPPQTEIQVVAGTGIDLSGNGAVCPHPDCMRAQVDELFRRVWHYFDRIVVRDAFTPVLTQDPIKSRKDLIETLLEHLPPLLYLQEIGAEHLVYFRSKSLCYQHIKQHADEQGLSELVTRRNVLRKEFRKTAEFHYSKKHGQAKGIYWIHSPELSSSRGLHVRDYPGKSEKQLQEKLLDEVLNQALVDLTADVTLAHYLRKPLGACVGLHGRMLTAAGHKPTFADVIVHLDLPVLDGLPIKHLLEVREREHESFIKFRDSLRLAIDERLKVSTDSQVVANQIRQDVIDPALVNIRQRLAASERSLTKKTGVAAFLTALTTTCGLLAHAAPATLVLSSAAVISAATNSIAQKYLDERQTVSLDSMYFLWKAAEHGH